MIKNRLLRYLSNSSLFFISFGQLAIAADDGTTEQYYLQDFPVVLSASRLLQPLNEAPNAMTVIDRDMIKASGFRTIPDLFRLVPGMYVSYNSGYEPFVAYHGTTDNLSRRMQVLVDGRSVFMPPMGSVSWETLPLQIDDIERLEVIRGPDAASHGGNSTQGVLNIITKEAGTLEGSKASVTNGNGGISDASIRVDKHGESLDYRISMGYRGDNGYDATPTAENNDSHFTQLFNLRSNYHPNAVDSFDIQLGFTAATLGTGQTGNANAPHDRKNNENFQQLTWLRSLENSNEFKLQFYHIYQNDQNSLPPIASFTALDDSFTNTRDNLELQHTLQTSSSNRLVWGASLRQDWAHAPARFFEDQTTTESTLFAHDEWRMTPVWLLNTGMMFEDSGLGQKHLSPRVAVIYKVAQRQSLRASISQAYRNPSVYEERGYYHFMSVYPNGIYRANGGLRSESVLSREIGYLGEFIDQGFSIDARIYHDRLNDIIYETAAPYPKDFVNLFGAEHNGFELTTKHYWGDRNQLTFNYSYQILSSDYDLTYANPYSGTMPRNMISALYSKKFANEIAFSLGYYQQDAMLPIDRWHDTPGDTYLDQQTFTSRWDMRIAKTFKKFYGDAEGEIALVVQGLFDEHYFDYINTNKFNQRAYLTTSVRF
jgi:iron complex outermembrane receptor protein